MLMGGLVDGYFDELTDVLREAVIIQNRKKLGTILKGKGGGVSDFTLVFPT